MPNDKLSTGTLVVLNIILFALLAYVFVRIRSARRASRQPTTQTFTTTPELFWNAVTTFLGKKGYTIVSKSENRLIFETGLSLRSWRGQTMEVETEWSDRDVVVRVSGQAKRSFQLYDWHESSVVALALLRSLRTTLTPPVN